jgi:hypothetical protein
MNTKKSICIICGNEYDRRKITNEMRGNTCQDCIDDLFIRDMGQKNRWVRCRYWQWCKDPYCPHFKPHKEHHDCRYTCGDKNVCYERAHHKEMNVIWLQHGGAQCVPFIKG